MKTNQLLRWVMMLVLSIFLFSPDVFAQTDPSAFDMSSGASYSLTSWPAASAALTYPANMMFQKTGTQDPILATNMNSNYTGVYNGSSGTRMNGGVASGFSFTNTSTSGTEGSAVLALNTTNRANITIGWTGTMLGALTYNASTQNRFYRIRLQYRVGTSSSFTDVLGPVEFVSDSLSGTTYKANNANQSFSSVLPATCNGQSVVQVRWYYYNAAGSSGTRPTLGVGNISATSSVLSTLSVSSINSNQYVFANTPFTVTVTAPSNVTTNTGISLSLASGTGTLSGTLTGTILAGQNSTTISGVLYNTFDLNVSLTATRTSGDLISPATSAVFTVLPSLTNPTPYNLSAGNYLFSSFDPLTPAATYPANMAFHRMGPSVLDPASTEQSYQDYTSAYNATSQTRITGLSGSGFSFINTSTSGNLGDAVLALNCNGRSNINVSWNSSVNNALTYNASSQNRFYSLRAQYRVGTAGAFTDFPGPVEFVSAASASSYKAQGALENLSFMLPSACNNQPLVQVRWIYYQASGTSGTRPEITMDEILVVSDPPFLPSNLKISDINNLNSVSAGEPFSITVSSVTSANFAANVSSNTNVTLSLNTGSGVLGGTLSGVILAGQNSVTISGITYSTPESNIVVTATRTSGDVLSQANSAPFNVLGAATQMAFVNLPLNLAPNQTFPVFTVQARRADNSLDPNYTGNITLSIASGPGTIAGTVTKPCIAGVATFYNISLTAAGFYTLYANSGILSQATSDQISIIGVTEVIMPQYMEGVSGTNTNRVPYACRLTISGLLQNGYYWYYNQAVVSSDLSTTSGAGNIIFAPYAGGFYRSSSASFTSSGNYGEIFADANGEYTGWFIIEPTGNARFAEGDSIYMRIILNDGNGGTSVASRVTTSQYAIVKSFGTSATNGSSIYGNSLATPSNFVFLYDNTAGTGRPIAGTFVEDDLVDNSTANSYSAFYSNNVNTVNGAWGLLIPNNLPTGIRRIEQRDFDFGAIVGCPATDADGIWPSGANTVNPVNGISSNIAITATDAPLVSPTATAGNSGSVCAGSAVTLTATGGASYSWSGPNGFTSTQQNPVVSGTTAASSGTYTVTATNGVGAGCSASATTSVTVINCSAINLVVTSVNGGVSPSMNVPFYITVESQNYQNLPTNVIANTNVSITLNTGTGVLGGTLTGIILAGQNSVTITGVLYNVAETNVSVNAVRTSGDVLATGVSAPFTVLGAATHLVFANVPATGTANTNLSTFTISALRADNTVDVNYTNAIAVGVNSGPGTLSGTVSQSPVNGVATYSNLQLSSAGLYTLSGSSSGLPTIISGTIVVPGIIDVIIPQYMEGISGTNSQRLPYAFRVQLVGLNANATYRFQNQAVISTDLATASGAGNMIFAQTAGAFVRTSSPSFSTAGNYGEFTTDASGSYTGWFVLEPTGNSRFAQGNTVFQRIILNDGAGGTSASLRLTTTLGANVRTMGATATNGTAIYGISSAVASNFVLLYDNAAGTGRPLSGTFVESDGTVNSTANSFAAFYSTNVEAQASRWGTIIPNGNASGVQRIEQRSLSTGAIVGCPATDVDGIWPSGANTVNTVGGTTPVAITLTDAPLISPTASASNSGAVCAGGSVTLSGSGTGSYSWSGPNGFSSTSQNPVISNATVAATGTYTLTVSNGTASGCSAVATTSVVVNALPTVTASYVSGCAGSPIALTGSPAGGSWSVSNPYTGSSTTYTYSYTDANGCSNTSASANITVNPLPIVTANDLAGCAGSAIALSGTPSGGTWSIANPYTGSSTTYTHTYTDGNGCTNTSSAANITVYPIPTATASSNSPVCAGQNLVLDANGGASYSWSGPNGFTSNAKNPTINGVSAVVAGTYIATVSVNGCSSIATTTVVLNSAPVISCPGNIEVNAVSGTCAQIATYTATASGTPAPVITYSTPSGSSFNVGTTLVVATATNSCGVSTCSFNVNVNDTQIPVIITSGTTLTLGCNPTPAEINAALGSAIATDNCSVGSPVAADGAVSGTSCSHTQTRTWNVSDASNNAAVAVSRTVSWTSASPLSFDNLPSGSYLGCNVSAPTCASVTASNECGTVNAVCTAGAETVNGCVHSQTFNYHAVSSCGADADANVTYTWSVSTDLTFDNLPTGSYLGCNVTAPTCAAVTASNTCGTVNAICTPGAETVNGCVHSQTFNYHAVSSCGADADANVTYTWSVSTDLAFDNLPTGSYLGCNVTAPTCAAVTASNTCGTVNAICTPGAETVNGCVHSQTFNYHAVSSCGADADANVTYTWSVSTDLAFDNLPTGSYLGCNVTAPTCAAVTASNTCGTVNAICTPGAETVNGCVHSQTFNYHAVSSCGAPADANVTYTWRNTSSPVFTGVGSNATIVCPTTPVFSNPTASNSCGIASVTFADQSIAGSCAGSYTKVRTWTATDVCGNQSTASQSITVIDNIAPSIVAPANQVINARLNGCGAVACYAAPVGTDNCSSVTTTRISGLASGSVFPVGITTITYKATDACGNNSTASFTIKVVAPAAPSFTEAVPAGYCQDKMFLTVTVPGGGSYTYNWTTSDGNIASGQGTATISAANHAHYTVTVNETSTWCNGGSVGCSQSFSYYLNNYGTNLISNYVILGATDVHLHGHNTVMNGGVGATAASMPAGTGSGDGSGCNGGRIKIHTYTNFVDGTTFAMAKCITVDASSHVAVKYPGTPANPPLPAFDNGVVVPSNATDITVNDNTTMTLTGSVYGDIKLKKNATLIFDRATVDILSLTLGQGAKVRSADPCMKIRMSGKLSMDKNSVLNPVADNHDFAIYMKHVNNTGSGGHGSGGQGSGGANTSVNIKQSCDVKAFIYAPNAKISVHGPGGNGENTGSGSGHHSTFDPDTMIGLFIGKTFLSHGAVVWNWNTVCATCNYSLREGEVADNSASATLATEDVNSGLTVENFPDPFKDKTNIRFIMDTDTHARVEVYDMNGRFISTIFNSDVVAKKEYRFEFDGTDLSNGMYIYKVITPNDVHTGKMLLIK